MEMAIKMEEDGKAFYTAASRKTTDALGKELLLQLADEEDYHAVKARQIYDALKRNDAAEVELALDKGKRIKHIFAKAAQDMHTKVEVASTVMESIELALDMEEKSRKFYEEHSKNASNDQVKKFLRSLALEERGHYVALADYSEYLIDTAGWLRKAEHLSLDGG